MTALRATLASVLVLVALPAASPAQPTRVTLVPVKVEGSAQVSFHADPGTGCANPCGLSGSVSWSPGRSALLAASEQRRGGVRKLRGSLLFIASPLNAGTATTAHVGMGAPGGSSCSDVQSRPITTIDLAAASPAHLNVSLAGGGAAPGIFQTRCGGPVDGDLASAMTVKPIDSAMLHRGNATIDLSGTRPFASGGLAGTVDSSVKLRLGHSLPLPSFDLRPRRGPTGGRREPRVLFATYRIERVSGAATTNFTGGTDSALCAPLGVCGVSGTVRVAPLASSGSATFLALAESPHTTRAQLRAALGLAPGRRVHGLSIFATGDWQRDQGAVTETFNGTGGACAGSVPLGSGALNFTFGRRRVFVSYGHADAFDHTPYRTRCPGPALGDVAQDHPLATGQVPLRAFRHRRVVIRLVRNRPFESSPYAGETRAALTVVLRRAHVGGTENGLDSLIIRRAVGG